MLSNQASSCLTEIKLKHETGIYFDSNPHQQSTITTPYTHIIMSQADLHLLLYSIAGLTLA